jgi:hypothetical protein
MNIATILDRLGPPDFATREISNTPNSAPATKWTYFFTSPVPAGRRGGGFPELTFVFGADNQVVEVSCHYSR